MSGGPSLTRRMTRAGRMSLLLIDDQGELWRGESRQLRAAFDSPHSGGEFVEYAVKNLGFVAINMYGSSCQVRLRPGFVGGRAIAGFRNWLQQIPVQRVVLTTFDKGWRDELIQPGRIAERLDSLLGATAAPGTDTFLSSPIPVAAFGQASPLGAIIENWTHLVSEYEADTLLRLLRSVFRDQYVIVKRQPEHDRLIFQEFGDKMYWRYETWRTCAIGAPIEEQPDRGFGRWVAESYREALADGTPRHDKVDAILHCPESGRIRRRYRRLIFPVATASAGELVVGGSFDDLSVDLRIPSR